MTVPLYSIEPHLLNRFFFNFMIFNQACVSLIGERRICYPKFEIPDIVESCTYEIAVLQEILVTKEIHWELLVYGPDRAWHR